MERHLHYINGTWVDDGSTLSVPVVNPATGAVIGMASAGTPAVAARAIEAAAAAFPAWASTPLAERLAAVQCIRDGLAARAEEAAALITAEMGSPLAFSRAAQLGLPLRNLDEAGQAVAGLALEEYIGSTLVVREPVGVVAAITPWNFPLHQITAKVAPALLAGCTVVLKPSEVTPLDACLLAQVVEAAGLPPGVFNLVLGTGANVGEVLASHPAVDMVSFTGSTAAGTRVAALAAPTVKRVALELGGKSANLLLDDADLDAVVPKAVAQCFVNAGQTCAALTRLLVPQSGLQRAEALAVAAAESWTLGDPLDPATRMGPLSSLAQQQRVRSDIESGLRQGARLLTGGLALPAGLRAGAYVLPTVFSNVGAHMRIVREEIFGPVLVLQAYADEAAAVAMANDSDYGLSGGVWSADAARAARVARRLRTGHVVINGAPLNVAAPFGGFKRSGLGREYGRHGLEEFFEFKSLQGAA